MENPPYGNIHKLYPNLPLSLRLIICITLEIHVHVVHFIYHCAICIETEEIVSKGIATYADLSKHTYQIIPNIQITPLNPHKYILSQDLSVLRRHTVCTNGYVRKNQPGCIGMGIP